MYSPKIAEDLIPVLYRMGKRTKVPMTQVVDDILRKALLTEADRAPHRQREENHPP